MKHYLSLMVLLFLAPMALSQSISRSLISPSGSQFLTGSLFGSFSTGQIANVTFSSQSLIITQGYQQGSMIEPVTGLSNSIDISRKFIVYPNPAENTIQFKLKDEKGIEFNIQAFDSYGKEILFIAEAGVMIGQGIDISDFAVGNYLFRITSKDQKYFGLVRISKIK